MRDRDRSCSLHESGCRSMECCAAATLAQPFASITRKPDDHTPTLCFDAVTDTAGRHGPALRLRRKNPASDASIGSGRCACASCHTDTYTTAAGRSGRPTRRHAGASCSGARNRNCSGRPGRTDCQQSRFRHRRNQGRRVEVRHLRSRPEVQYLHAVFGCRRRSHRTVLDLQRSSGQCAGLVQRLDQARLSRARPHRCATC